jgi:type II secretory pathway pseudopilin PulG
MKFPTHMTARGGMSSSPKPQAAGLVSGFTMMEIAICLAIIGFALVAIIGVLPYGMNTQRDNREETIINQDATVLLNDIRSGAYGSDDLTNYVYAITNNRVFYNNGVPTPELPAPGVTTADLLTNGTMIVGLLSTPEFTDANGIPMPLPPVNYNGWSNHIVAYVRSMSGPAAEKPPQDNPIMREDTFAYRLLLVNAPMPMDTNLLYLYPAWNASAYLKESTVFTNWTYWLAIADTSATNIPGQSPKWVETPLFPLKLAFSQRELRLTFLWPQLPNGNLGNGRQTFRSTIAGQLTPVNYNGQLLYFYQPQTFINVP